VHVTYDSGFWCGPHVGFRPVTYTGILKWQGKSTEGTDDDYEIDIYRDDQAMYVAGGDHIEIEFDSDETVDEFSEANVAWWRGFRDLVNNGDAPNVIDNHEGIIIAPADLDGSHHYSVELHPAWLFMVHVRADSGSDQWAFFVRNWGNKGYCSDDDHHLELQDISVLISRPGATGGYIDQSSEAIGNNISNEYIRYNFEVNGLLLTFHLPPPDDHGWIAGKLHIVWQFLGEPPPVQRPAPPRSRPSPLMLNSSRAEDAVDALVLQMNDDQRARYLNAMKGCRRRLPEATKGPVKIQQGNPNLRDLPPGPPKSPVVRTVHDLGRPPQCREGALCDVFDGRVPRHPELCDMLKRGPSNPKLSR
jgi:hypothetical protein